MRLKVIMPNEILLDEEVGKIVGEDENGSFCLLPRHLDCTTVLIPGLLSYTDRQDRERFLAIDGGILVKCSSQVQISTQNAVLGADLGYLRSLVDEQFRVLDERERLARTALAKLESSFVRRLIEMEV